MKKIKTVDMILCALFSALICVGAFMKIPIPLIPITFQLFFTTLAGLILGAKLGALSVLVYIIAGLAGVPIFTQGGGIGYVLQPTFGYLIGFVIGAYAAGRIAETSEKPSFKRLLCANFAGVGIVYVVGMIYYFLISTLYLNNKIGVWTLFLHCFVLVAPGDIIMSIIAAFAAKKIIPIKNIYIRKNAGNKSL